MGVKRRKKNIPNMAQHMEIATYRLNRPRGQLSERKKTSHS